MSPSFHSFCDELQKLAGVQRILRLKGALRKASLSGDTGRFLDIKKSLNSAMEKQRRRIPAEVSHGGRVFPVTDKRVEDNVFFKSLRNMDVKSGNAPKLGPSPRWKDIDDMPDHVLDKMYP